METIVIMYILDRGFTYGRILLKFSINQKEAFLFIEYVLLFFRGRRREKEKPS